MRVLVIGATGGTGRELVPQALERGHIAEFLLDQLSDERYLRAAPGLAW